MHRWVSGFSVACVLADAMTSGYTFDMDSARFGKALGMGARHAAKALVTAADAATSPNPTTPSTPRAAGEPVAAQPSRAGETISQKAARTAAQARQTKDGLSRGSKRFGEAVWGPFVKLSGVLWLELTGVFFGLFLLTATLNAWKLRANVHDTGPNHVAHQHLLFSIAMAVTFGYFCISSFIRANRKQHRSR